MSYTLFSGVATPETVNGRCWERQERPAGLPVCCLWELAPKRHTGNVLRHLPEYNLSLW